MEPSSGSEQADGGEQAANERAVDGVPAHSLSGDSSNSLLHKHYVVNDAIGKALQAHFRALADAPLPDRFLDLLAELEARTSNDEK
jgi:hypothetical protein